MRQIRTLAIFTAITILSLGISFMISTSQSYAANNKNSDKALERNWNNDGSLVRLMENDDSIIYGVKGTLKEVIDSDGFRTSWTKTLFKASKRSELKAEFNKATYYSMLKWEFDCNSNKLYVSKVLYYNQKGRVVSSSDINESWQEPIPQSIGEYMIQLACNYTDDAKVTMKAQEIPEGVGKKGVVLETMSTGGYTYINALSDNGIKQWLCLPEIIVNVGEKIEYPETPPLSDFESKTLKRTFDSIMFVPGLRIIR